MFNGQMTGFLFENGLKQWHRQTVAGSKSFIQIVPKINKMAGHLDVFPGKSNNMICDA